MKLNNIVIEKTDNICVVKFNRPNVLNALDSDTIRELDFAIDKLAEDDSILAVIITGEGKAFVAGADISEMKNLNSVEGRSFGMLGSKVFRKLEALEKPVIAAVNGFALGGGCEISMACDIRLASTKAKFGQPETGLGITPGFGGTQRLPRIVGMGMAKELIYTGRIIDANEALRIGLVNKVIEAELLMDEAKALAKTITANAPIAVKLCKEAINRGMQCDINTGLSYESEVFGQCFSTEDQEEGMEAFTEKRNKSFKNR